MCKNISIISDKNNSVRRQQYNMALHVDRKGRAALDDNKLFFKPNLPEVLMASESPSGK